MARTAILARIYPHEQEAMLKLAQLARALASSLPPTETHTMRMRVWARMVEEVLERIEQNETVQ
jgi:predicted RNase H-like nuclease